MPGSAHKPRHHLVHELVFVKLYETTLILRFCEWIDWKKLASMIIESDV